MKSFFLEYSDALRLVVFAVALVLMLCLEAAFARKARTQNRLGRWRTNAAMIVIDSALLKLMFPVAASAAALWCQTQGWGVLNSVDLPVWASIVIALIALDFLIYVQHVASHKIPILWALHKVHHTDRDIDVTTALRFHPLEIALSMLFKVACVAAIGAPFVVVVIFEITLNACAIFNHSNWNLPKAVDRRLRLFMVTPDMHRVHHSIVPQETNSNYGFSVSVWDFLFKTYVDQPSVGHDDMTIGLAQHQDVNPSSLRWALLLPFRAG